MFSRPILQVFPLGHMQGLCLVNTVQAAHFVASLMSLQRSSVPTIHADGLTHLRCGTTITNASELLILSKNLGSFKVFFC